MIKNEIRFHLSFAGYIGRLVQFYKHLLLCDDVAVFTMQIWESGADHSCGFSNSTETISNPIRNRCMVTATNQPGCIYLSAGHSHKNWYGCGSTIILFFARWPMFVYSSGWQFILRRRPQIEFSTINSRFWYICHFGGGKWWWKNVLENALCALYLEYLRWT